MKKNESLITWQSLISKDFGIFNSKKKSNF